MSLTKLEEKCIGFLLYVQDVLQDGVEEIVEEAKEKRKRPAPKGKDAQDKDTQ